MGWYIKSKSEGYFIGECLGLGFFQAHIWDGTCSSKEKPSEFLSREEAEDYLNSWTGGTADCFVTSEPPKIERYKPPRKPKYDPADYLEAGAIADAYDYGGD